MLLYYLKCIKNAESKIPKVIKSKIQNIYCVIVKIETY